MRLAPRHPLPNRAPAGSSVVVRAAMRFLRSPVAQDGTISLASKIASGGPIPVSLTTNRDRPYVLNISLHLGDSAIHPNVSF